VPAASGVQVPGVALQTPHAPHSVEQQTLSTQLRVAH